MYSFPHGQQLPNFGVYSQDKMIIFSSQKCYSQLINAIEVVWTLFWTTWRTFYPFIIAFRSRAGPMRTSFNQTHFTYWFNLSSMLNTMFNQVPFQIPKSCNPSIAYYIFHEPPNFLHWLQHIVPKCALHANWTPQSNFTHAKHTNTRTSKFSIFYIFYKPLIFTFLFFIHMKPTPKT